MAFELESKGVPEDIIKQTTASMYLGESLPITLQWFPGTHCDLGGVDTVSRNHVAPVHLLRKILIDSLRSVIFLLGYGPESRSSGQSTERNRCRRW